MFCFIIYNAFTVRKWIEFFISFKYICLNLMMHIIQDVPKTIETELEAHVGEILLFLPISPINDRWCKFL